MTSPTFKSTLKITHVGTATAVLNIDGVNLLTDPFFSPAGTEFDVGVATLKNADGPALELADIPPIDAVLLSHEDHPDNLDELGRRLLDGRKVLTTVDGAKNLQPRPGVRGLRPWETVPLIAGDKHFRVTGTPCQHLPGGECTGFIIESDSFGSTDGLPNVIYFSGDTVYIDELARIREKYHVTAALLNLGAAVAPLPDGPVQITMDGKQAVRLFREIRADILVPMHFESWGHFTQFGKDLARVFEAEGIQDKVCWLTPGEEKKVI
ncbi:putative Zn-dependent hydrolases of the beta-lactamase protein [Macrophomina phaseolina]|uniref:Zn-dependent hydrolases of the beta-lactamase protein n=1 Tax=Macrophomina phaseolina TaxID=35725 RepID=A0ABQ8G1Z9_9PEZI|nr:putative Zn-dependent hydrolases of the beta-lactamase protein [Macrophomina phaseolina]